MAPTYRRVKGSNLTPDEVDDNFEGLDERLSDIEDNPPVAVPPSNMTVVGTQWTIYYPDGLTFGPFTLPQAAFRPSITDELDLTTDGTYVLVLADANRYKRHTGSTDATVLMPLNTDVAFAIDAEISFRVASTGAIVFETATAGPTINFPDGLLNRVSTMGATVTLKKVATDEWDAIGLFDEDVTA
jgi:hypothetical protein